MPIELPDATITHEQWMKYLIMNVDNLSLTAEEFRNFVAKTLPTVLGYQIVKDGLIESGKKIPGEPRKRTKVHQQDMPSEDFYNK